MRILVVVIVDSEAIGEVGDGFRSQDRPSACWLTSSAWSRRQMMSSPSMYDALSTVVSPVSSSAAVRIAPTVAPAGSEKSGRAPALVTV